jgi:hypothetical protein
MIHLGTRKGDNAKIARLEWARKLEEPKEESSTSRKGRTSSTGKEDEVKVERKASLKDKLPLIGKTKKETKKEEEKSTKKTVKKGAVKK